MYKLVFYDIENDKIRTKLAKKMEEMGLIRIQYSVFIGNGNEVYWSKVLEKIKKLTESLNFDKDSCCFLVVDKTQIIKMRIFGNESIKANYVIDCPDFLLF